MFIYTVTCHVYFKCDCFVTCSIIDLYFHIEDNISQTDIEDNISQTDKVSFKSNEMKPSCANNTAVVSSLIIASSSSVVKPPFKDDTSVESSLALAASSSSIVTSPLEKSCCQCGGSRQNVSWLSLIAWSRTSLKVKKVRLW